MPKKIMVVDDDPVVVKYLETLFQDNGYETCSAGDGVEAAEVFHKEKPDLITLDLEMGREWGTRFYRKLTKEEDFKDVPVIVISGMPRPDLAIKKAIATIAKPFNPEQVLKIVKEAIG